ncbi:major facilitator superfamily domain-containing protein [Haematococcus lacustris]
MGAADAVAAEKGTPVMPQFDVPVDSEHKAKVIRIFSFGQPHMRSMHLAWFAFFMTFLATFAPASLITVIRENLVIDRWQNGSAGVAAVCGAIAFRLFMGAFLDNVGPRMGTAFTLLMLSPAVFCIALVNDIAGYTAARLFIGCSLCMFVCCQFWVGIMFNVRIVGFANAIAAGWGNMGGGACHFIMPLLYQAIKQAVPGFQAWRWSFFIPGGIYIVTGIVVLLFGQDAPDGDFRDLKRSGAMASAKGNVWATLKHGMLNYRTIVLALTYGYSFGVELTVDNIIVAYLYDQFQMNLTTAGGLGALFGLMNLFSRASGGLLSDLAAVRWGMRGRLWTLWIIQTLGGVFCLIMGYMDYSLGATVATMVIFSIFCQQACGAHFGIAPFISRRAYGVVSGVIGAGGNLGSVATQLIFFAGSAGSPVMTPQDGLIWMGVMTIGLTMILFTLWWPMWGSMLTPAKEDYAEEDYYLKEWSAEEVSQNLHITAMKFAMESRSQRGAKPMNGQMSAAALNATAGMANQNVQPGVVEVVNAGGKA